MITPRSALKFDLFADASRKRKMEAVGDPLQVIAQHIDFTTLAALVDAFIERSDGRKGGRPAYPTEVMVRVLVLKRLYNLSDEQIEYQLLDRMSYQRFCLLQDSMNVPDRNTIWRFGERIGADGGAALLHGVNEPLHRHGHLSQGARHTRWQALIVSANILSTRWMPRAISWRIRPMRLARSKPSSMSFRFCCAAS